VPLSKLVTEHLTEQSHICFQRYKIIPQTSQLMQDFIVFVKNVEYQQKDTQDIVKYVRLVSMDLIIIASG